MNIPKSPIAFTLFSLLLFSCSKDRSSKDETQLIPSVIPSQTLKSENSYQASYDASPEQMQEHAERNNNFALSSYSELLKSEPKNLVFSPFSLQSGFALLYPGLAGKAEQEVANTFGFSINKEDFYPLAKTQQVHYRKLNDVGANAKGDEKKLSFLISNELWVEQTRDLQTEFLDTIKSSFDAGVRKLDFKNYPEASSTTINEFVKDATDGLIQDLLSKDSINRDTTVVLTNAISMNADWAVPFKKENTQKTAKFNNLDGTQSTVEMMRSSQRLQYTETELYQAVSLPYAYNSFAMMLILPRQSDDFGKLQASLNADNWKQMKEGLKSEKVNLALPKFKMTWGTKALKPTFEALGLKSIFEPSANNFSKLLVPPTSGSEEGLLDNVYHQATLIVDEKGTTAAAATAAVVVMPTSAANPEEPKNIRIDRPALFAIYDIEYGNIVFMGHITQL